MMVVSTRVRAFAHGEVPVSTTTHTPRRPEVVYPDSDGLPMADNTRQFDWITKVKPGLEGLLRDQGEVFVAGDLLWYPVEGEPKVRVAPDVLVAFGRPPGPRGSYKQWEEGGVAPQVVFEFLSPGNTQEEMDKKFEFYQRHGVEEYYLYDPETNKLEGWLRRGERLVAIRPMTGWTSPRLGVRFDWTPQELELVRPDGRPIEDYHEVADRAQAAEQRAQAERQRAEAEALRAQAERQRAEAERQRAQFAQEQAQAAEQRAQAERQRAEAEHLRAERLAAQLRALGIEPGSPPP